MSGTVLVTLQILLVAAIVTGLWTMRARYGRGLLLVFLGTTQYVQMSWASAIYVELLGGFTASPGSIVLFAGSLFAVLLVYLTTDVPQTRALIYGVFLANLAVVALTWTLYAPGVLTWIPGDGSLPVPLDIWAFFTGSVLLAADSLLVIVAYESLARLRVPLAARLILSLVFVLAVDSVLWLTISAWGDPAFGARLGGNLVGKIFSGLLYGSLLTVVIRRERRGDPRAAEPDDSRDVFSILQYRSRLARAESRRRETERRMSLLLGATPDFVGMADVDGRVLFVNRAGRRLLGFGDEEDLSQLSIAEFLPPHDRARYAAEALESARERGSWRGETALLHRDGREILTSQVVLYHSGEDEVGDYFSTIARDMTAEKAAERVLLESNARLELAQRTARLGFLDWDLRSDEVFLSAEIRRLLGIASLVRAWQGEDFFGFVHPDDRDRVVRALRRARNADDPLVLDYRLQGRDGASVWVQTHTEIERGSDGIAVRLVGTVLDTTSQRTAEAERHEISVRLVETLEQMLDGFIALDGASVCTFANRTAGALLSRPPESIIGASLWESFPGDIRPLFDERARDAVRLQQAVEFEIEYPARGRWLWVRVSPLHDGLAVFFRDASLEHEARAALQASEERYQHLFDEAGDGMVVMDDAGRLLEVNRRMRAMVGRDRVEELEPVLARLMRRPEGRAHVLPHPDGREIAVDVNASTLALGRTLLVVRDVTERRAMEQRLAQAGRLEAVGQLAGGIAHDFNNILTAILGTTELLRSGLPPGSDLAGDAEIIRDAAVRAATLTEQLLAFSRRQALQPTAAELRAIIMDIARLLQRVIGEHIRLDTRVEGGASAVWADRGQLERVLMNLAANSRDAMPKGGTLTITAGEEVITTPRPVVDGELPAGRWIVLTVSDTGTGIAERDLPHIFEPFFSTKATAGGTGLGLASTYGFVRQSAGHIEVRSSVESGTTFRIYLPPAPTPGQSGAPSAVPQSPGGTEHILLVEDDDAVRAIARRILVARGYQVRDFASAADALAFAGDPSEPIDLLLSDLVMPGMSGVELASAVSALRPLVPVRLMSGYPGGIGTTTEAAGALRFLEKPFTPDALARYVRTALDGRRPAS